MNTQDAQVLAEKTYLENITYLQSEQKELYTKLSAFDSALEQNVYKENYELVFENDYFDVKDINGGNFLYNSNSDDYAQTATQSINYQKDSNVFKTFIDTHVTKDNIKKYEQLQIHENAMSGITPILNYIQNQKEDNTKLMQIDKFIFFGVGLGQHIIGINEKIKAKVYLIIEDNLELFRLSLFITPYSQLSKTSQLIFSIFESNEEFSQTSKHFINTDFYFNHYIKYFHMLNHNEEKLQQFHIAITTQSHNLFSYSAILDQYLKPLNYLSQKYQFLNILETYENTLLGNTPVLYLAAGPSLLKNIVWVKENQNKFIIVAVSATLIELEKQSIFPDIVTHLDGFDISTKLFSNLQSTSFLKDTSFLLSARTPQKIINLLDKNKVFFFENGTNYKNTFGNLSAPCIGSTSYLLLLAFRVRELYLLGLDLSVDKETGYTHAKTHVDTKQMDLSTADVHEDTMALRESIVSYPSNFGTTAFTNPNFLISIESINSTSIGFKKEDQNVYNLSDGVLFSNTLPQQINKVKSSLFNSLDKEDIKKIITSDFYKNTAIELNTEENNMLLQRYSYIKKIKKVLEKQKIIQIYSNQFLLTSLKTLFSDLTMNTSPKAHDISLVYQEYFHLINSFIFDFFNNEEISLNIEHAYEVNKLLVIQLMRIIEQYEKELEKFIK